MKLLFKDIKRGEIKIKTENLEDLWYLSNIIDNNDLIKGKTLRKIKIGEKDQRSLKIIKKPVFIEIKTEKIEYNSDILRILGKIIQGPEDIPLGSYHAFNIDENSIITMKKEKWLKFQLEKLKEACQEKSSKILIVVHDREEAYFALMRKYGYDILTTIKGNVPKKDQEQQITGNFYLDLIKQIIEYVKRYQIKIIILGSPAFWKEDLMKELKDEELKKIIILATCSSVGKNGIEEILKRPETREALKRDRISKEMNLVEKLLEEISKNNLASYGLKEVENCVTAGAVKSLLITDKFISDTREKNNYEKIDSLLKNVEKQKGVVDIISSTHDGGKKLDGLGGIGAILRFKLNY